MGMDQIKMQLTHVFLLSALVLCGCGSSLKTFSVPVTHESTLNSVTHQDTGIVQINLVPLGVETAPVAIRWSEQPILSPIDNLIAYEFVITGDSVSVTTSDAMTTFRNPVHGERLQIRMGQDSIPRGFLSGTPELQYVEVEVQEIGWIDQVIDGAQTVIGILIRLIIALAILSAIVLIGYVIFQVIQNRKKQAIVKGTADVLKELIKGLRPSKIKLK